MQFYDGGSRSNVHVQELAWQHLLPEHNSYFTSCQDFGCVCTALTLLSAQASAAQPPADIRCAAVTRAFVHVAFSPGARTASLQLLHSACLRPTGQYACLL
jgi:hypothetical protein